MLYFAHEFHLNCYRLSQDMPAIVTAFPMKTASKLPKKTSYLQLHVIYEENSSGLADCALQFGHEFQSD